ncbi:hypothetical protein AVEN_54964-1 [Araneus ventricosus]|uniref:Uncharacterized protein n=1 Tax=Araneus ventricosus TaxID=182803 RepID=A0A4Y2M9N5_ARAVE|nr:hypothetical protein AVEN_54964-1 [Araneus ventricosus]
MWQVWSTMGCRRFYVLICWTLEVVRKHKAALGGRVKRHARFFTGTAVVRVFSESEKIGREGPVPCDKLDYLSRPIMISKSNLVYDFICGATIDSIIPTPLPLSQGSVLENFFALLLGRGTVSTAASVDVIASLASSSAFSVPRCPT